MMSWEDDVFGTIEGVDVAARIPRREMYARVTLSREEIEASRNRQPAQTWNDLTRSENPFWRSQAPSAANPSGSFTVAVQEHYWQMARMRAQEEQRQMWRDVQAWMSWGDILDPTAKAKLNPDLAVPEGL